MNGTTAFLEELPWENADRDLGFICISFLAVRSLHSMSIIRRGLRWVGLFCTFVHSIRTKKFWLITDANRLWGIMHPLGICIQGT